MLFIWRKLFCKQMKEHLSENLLFVEQLEIELNFCGFCVSDAIVIICLSTHMRYSTDLVCENIRVIEKYISLPFVKQKQSSDIDNARKYSAEDRGRFEIYRAQ